MAHALQHTAESQQLTLYRRVAQASRAAAKVAGARIGRDGVGRDGVGRDRVAVDPRTGAAPAAPCAPLCAGCRNKEARYGFRDAKSGELRYDRPRTLCFECFRVEIGRRQAVAAQLARGWNAAQTSLPLDDTALEERLRDATRRRRRAQIAARHALELR